MIYFYPPVPEKSLEGKYFDVYTRAIFFNQWDSKFLSENRAPLNLKMLHEILKTSFDFFGSLI